MKRWAWAALLSVLVLGVVVRFLPLGRFVVWGSDTGEYAVLTSRLLESGTIVLGYNGWGFGYPYFPGMFLLTGATQMLAGIPAFDALLWVTPVAGALSVMMIALIAFRAFGDIRAGLVAGGFLAVNTPSAFSTSHAMPGTLGDMLALMCILLLLKALEKRAALVALVFSTMALVMTHHLSTFFVLMPVLLALLVRELLRVKWDVARTRVEGGYAVFLLSVTLLFWYAYAVPFRERVIPEGFNTSPWVMLVLAYLALLLIPGLVLLRRRLSPTGMYRPVFPSFRRVAIMYALFIAVGVSILAGTALLTMPGTNINVDDRAAYWFTPQLLLIGISMAGSAWAEYSREGMFIWAWLGALTAIFLLGAATNNHVLIPYRMTQYIIEPLAVFAGAGAIFLHDQWNGKGDRRKAVALGSAIAVTFLLSAATAYPPREIIGGFEEGTDADEMDSVHWLRTGEGNAELLATDHRMSSIVWGYAGINTSWDDAKLTLHGDLEEARGEMSGLQTPTGFHRVVLVLLDPTIESGVALEQWESAMPLVGAAKEKFSDPLFIKEYEANGVVIYRVDGALL